MKLFRRKTKDPEFHVLNLMVFLLDGLDNADSATVKKEGPEECEKLRAMASKEIYKLQVRRPDLKRPTYAEAEKYLKTTKP